ncbi:MAG TPA: undecaprenyl-diphosphate phosphatase [Acidobacteriaceae bacterium]|jgi:undecaprenyl-diphosphatase|nr:undecaprenyl-diphosphate phosphatase [Acidobacteriaceae bacterium]
MLLKVLILAIIQGLTELLPVSSSAHVVVAEKLMGLNPSSPEMTLVLVMLHTGTMIAVIVFFWSQWRRTYFVSRDAFKRFVVRAIWATALTAAIGYPIIAGIEHAERRAQPVPTATATVIPCSYGTGDVEQLFSRLDIVAPALFAVGLLILWAGVKERGKSPLAKMSYERAAARSGENVTFSQAGWMGAVQGLCLPFRGFSRSGATISTGLLRGTERTRAERFSFALAVILTPAAIARETMRVIHAAHDATPGCTLTNIDATVAMSLIGMILAFVAGLAALRWLSSWLENGRWYWFGIYCLLASGAVFYLHHIGY